MTATTEFDAQRQLEIIRRTMGRRSFCVLATASAAGRPHAVGISYAAVGFRVYLLVVDDSIKARNIRDNPRVALSIPVRRLPILAPPMAIQFQGTARLLERGDAPVRELLAAGRLRKITMMGAGEQPGTCFVEVTPGRRIVTYGLGMSMLAIARDIMVGQRVVELPRALLGA